MNCVKEVRLRRGWACVVEGAYAPEGALALTKPPWKIAAYKDYVKNIFFKFLEEENLAENSLVITDGKGRAYLFQMPNAKLTVVLYAEDPAGEAVELVKYIDGTNRGFILDEKAVQRLYAEAGLLGLLQSQKEPPPLQAGRVYAESAQRPQGGEGVDLEELCEVIRRHPELPPLVAEFVSTYLKRRGEPRGA
ncbi:MAG: hypothetical protein QW680_05305 [Pyrobaculum sp.]